MNSRKFDKISVIVVFSILICGMTYTFFKQKSVSEYKTKVPGSIIKSEFVSSTYSLSYEYNVDNKIYRGTTGVSYVKCKSGKEFCIGETFDVYYSSENPSYSKIDLGKYSEYETTVQFFD